MEIFKETSSEQDKPAAKQDEKFLSLRSANKALSLDLCPSSAGASRFQEAGGRKTVDLSARIIRILRSTRSIFKLSLTPFSTDRLRQAGVDGKTYDVGRRSAEPHPNHGTATPPVTVPSECSARTAAVACVSRRQATARSSRAFTDRRPPARCTGVPAAAVVGVRLAAERRADIIRFAVKRQLAVAMRLEKASAEKL